MQSGVTDNEQTLDVNMYVPACETAHLYHIKKNDLVKCFTLDMDLFCVGEL